MDIVERLVKLADECLIADDAYTGDGAMFHEAAEEIRKLRAALREIEEQATAWRPPRYSWFGETAHAALAPPPQREYDPNVAPCDDAEFGMKP